MVLLTQEGDWVQEELLHDAKRFGGKAQGTSWVSVWAGSVSHAVFHLHALPKQGGFWSPDVPIVLCSSLSLPVVAE